MHLTKQVTAQKYWLEVINDYNIEPVTEQQQAAILLGRVIYRTVEINQSINKEPYQPHCSSDRSDYTTTRLEISGEGVSYS